VIPYSNVNSKKRELKRNWIERQLKQLKILTKFRISQQLIAANDWKEDVQHLCYGLVVCYEPQNYFQNYKQILSERDFNYFLQLNRYYEMPIMVTIKRVETEDEDE
jgi:hypothetical protein